MTSRAEHATYSWGRLRLEDVGAWAELTNLLATVDETDEVYQPEDLAEELGESGFDPERDSWAVWRADQLVGFGQLRVAQALDREGRVRCQLTGGVHPDHRRRGVGTELMDRMERRATQLSGQQHPGTPAYWRCAGGLEGSSARRMMEHRGYRVARYFQLMSRPLPGEGVATPVVPDGVRLVTPEPGLEEPLRRAHNQAFADHWGSTDHQVERWHDYWTARSNRWPASSVAVDSNSRPIAYVLVSQWVDREAYITLVGTVPEARGHGLAAACLARTIELAASSGDYDLLELDVDSASPTGATRLYERAGFRSTKTFATMVKDAVPRAGR